MHKRVLSDVVAGGQMAVGRKWNTPKSAGEDGVVDKQGVADRRPDRIGQDVLIRSGASSAGDHWPPLTPGGTGSLQSRCQSFDLLSEDDSKVGM